MTLKRQYFEKIRGESLNGLERTDANIIFGYPNSLRIGDYAVIRKKHEILSYMLLAYVPKSNLFISFLLTLDRIKEQINQLTQVYFLVLKLFANQRGNCQFVQTYLTKHKQKVTSELTDCRQ
jgi:hypothetical protein